MKIKFNGTKHQGHAQVEDATKYATVSVSASRPRALTACGTWPK